MYKHALAANGFFANGERVTEAVLNSGKLDYFFHLMEDKQWPVTLHCDLGCDNYDSVPWEQGITSQLFKVLWPNLDFKTTKSDTWQVSKINTILARTINYNADQWTL